MNGSVRRVIAGFMTVLLGLTLALQLPAPVQAQVQAQAGAPAQSLPSEVGPDHDHEADASYMDYSEYAAALAAATTLTEETEEDCATGDFGWPLDTNSCQTLKQAATSDFGLRRPPIGGNGQPGTKYHFALDLWAVNGTEVRAVADGEVIRVNNCGCFTTYVAIYHPSLDVTTLYYHLSSFAWTGTQINQINHGNPVEISKGDRLGGVGYGHLDLRVVRGRMNTIPGTAISYINTAAYFPWMDSGAPKVELANMKIRQGGSGAYVAWNTAKTSDESGEYIEVGEQDIWVGALVENDDKDTDDVIVSLEIGDGISKFLHHFFYYEGTSKVNTTMELAQGLEINTYNSGTGYVSIDSNPNANLPAKDRFHVKVPRDVVPPDGKIHKVVFRVRDANGNEVEGSLPVKRDAEYEIHASSERDEYQLDERPTFLVQVRSPKDHELTELKDDEEMTADFMHTGAKVERVGLGLYRVSAYALMEDEGEWPLLVEVRKKQDKRLVGSDTTTAKAVRPPRPEAAVDRCGNKTEWEWNPLRKVWYLPPRNLPCHPDDNASGVAPDPGAQTTGVAGTTVAVLGNGFTSSMVEMLHKAGVAAQQVPVDFSPAMAAQFPVLFVPSGGFAGLAQSDLMKERLARYVEGGGTLVVFAQPRGADFALLPGGEVTGYGYDEDIHCVYRSAGIASFGPQLMGQEEELLSFNLDGFFSELPEGATVLLRRTVTGAPAMFAYEYGQGRVFASSSYADMAAVMGQGTKAEVALLRDLAVWGLNPAQTYPTTALDKPFAVPVTLRNEGAVRAASVSYEMIGPDDVSYGYFEQSVDMAAGAEANVTAPVVMTRELDDGTPTPLGLWRLHATLFDSEGNPLGYLPNAAVYGVTVFEETPGGFRYQGVPYSLTVTSEKEEYLRGEKPTFTFHVFNHAETEQTFRVTFGLPHHQLGWDRGVERSITVPAKSEGSFTWQLESGVVDLDRLRALLWVGDQVVARAERSFWMAIPRPFVAVEPTKYLYSPVDTPALKVTLQELRGLRYEMHGTVTVVDWQGNEVATLPLDEQMEPYATVEGLYTLPDVLPPGEYKATVTLGWGGNPLAQKSVWFEVLFPYFDSEVSIPHFLRESTPITLHLVNGMRDFNGNVMYPGPDLDNVHWEMKLTDPNGEVIWNPTGTIDHLASGERKDLELTLTRPPLMFGTYYISWRLWLDKYGDIESVRTHLVSSFGMYLNPWNDKLTYRVRETATLRAVAYGLGRWAIDPDVTVTFPAVGFTGKAQLPTLGMDDAEETYFDVELPATLPAGSHEAIMTVRVNDTWSESIKTYVVIPPSKLYDRLERDHAWVGEELPITVGNAGGADTTGAFAAKLIDPNGKTVAETTAELAVIAGGESSFSLAVPPGTMSNNYRLEVTGLDKATGESATWSHGVWVHGVEGKVTVRPSQDLYLAGSPITLQGEVQSLQGRIDPGTVELAVYPTEVSATTCPPRPPFPLSPAVHWVGDCLPIYSPWNWGSFQQLYNEELSVVSAGGSITMGAIGGDPTRPEDDSTGLLYEHPHRPLSFVTVRVDGQDFIVGQGGQWTEPVHYDPATKSLTGVWSNGTVSVRETVSLGTEPDSRGTARIWYQVENISGDAHQVGVRLLLNTQVGHLTGGPFYLPGRPNIDLETEFMGDDVPDSFLTMRTDFLTVVGQGIVRTPGERAPDHLVLANYHNISRTRWEYAVQPLPWYGLRDDSAVAYYWSPTDLAPGQALSVGTRYGVGKVTQGKGELSTTLHLPTHLTESSPSPFTVRAIIRNTKNTTAANVQATITLPEGFALESGEELTRTVGALGFQKEAEVTWRARATGTATGPLTVKVSTSADNLGGSSAQRAVEVAGGDAGAGGPVWKGAVPVATDGTQAYQAAVGTLPLGKYYAAASLKVPGGQTLAFDQYPFLVSADRTLLTLQTDKRAYRPGEPVTVTGLVANHGPFAGNFTLKLSTEAGTLLTDTFLLEPGQSQPYSASLTAAAAGSITFRATAGEAHLAETVPVELPQVESQVDAPSVAGRDPFQVTVRLSNTGKLPAAVHVNVGGETRSFDLEPGAVIADTRTLQITADTTLPISLTGDVSRTESLLIRQGERVELSLVPAPAYTEGPIEMGYKLVNTGELPAEFTLRLGLGSQQVERSYILAPGASLTDAARFVAEAGQQELTWQTPYGQGQATLNVHRPVLDKVAMQATFPLDLVTGKLGVSLENQGENALLGSVLITTPWGVRALPVSLDEGASLALQDSIDPAAAPGAGTYPVTVKAVLNGQVRAEAAGTVTVIGPRLTMNPAVPAQVGVGTGATFAVQVHNTGDVSLFAPVTLDLPGVENQESIVALKPGESAAVDFRVAVPADLPSGLNHGAFRALELAIPFTYTVQGYTGSMSAKLDRTYYQPGSRPVLHLETETQVPGAGAEQILLRISGEDLDLSYPVPVGQGSFSVPLPAIAQDTTVSYGLYLVSGRSLYLSMVTARVQTGSALLVTDRASYAPGDTVTVTVVTREAGLLKLRAPGFTGEEQIPAGQSTLTFALPSSLQRGVHQIVYSFGGTERTHGIDVKAPGVAVMDARLYKEQLSGQMTVEPTLTLEASELMLGATVAWWAEYPNGETTPLQTLSTDIPAGRSRLTLEGLTFPTDYAGTYRLHFAIHWYGIEVNRGHELFDVAGPALLGLTPLKSAYREGQPVNISAAIAGHGAAELTLLVDGQQMSTRPLSLDGYQVLTFPLPGLTAGWHQVTALLQGGGLRSQLETAVLARALPTVAILIGSGAEPGIELIASEAGARIYYRWNDGPVHAYTGTVGAPPSGADSTLFAWAQIDGANGPTASRTIMTKRPSTLTAGAHTSVFGYAATLTAQLGDGLNPATAQLGGRTVTFSVGGQTVTGVTDAAGRVTVSVPGQLMPGTYPVQVTFAEDSLYLGSETSSVLTVTNSAGKVTAGQLRSADNGRGGLNIHFDGSVFKGELQFQSDSVKLHVKEFTALGIAGEGQSAWFAGTSTAGEPVLLYVEAAPAPGKPGRFQLWVAGQLVSGDLSTTGATVQIQTP